jgi:ketosteroid isomerase-like protein
MKTIVYLATTAFLLCSLGIAQAEENIPAAIKAAVTENLKATQGEDMDRMMKTIHTQSPGYMHTKQQMTPIFGNFDLSYRLLSFSYIGSDGEYAVARVKQATTKVSGPAFQNNELDLMQVFRKENGQWKFWAQTILGIKYTNE